MARVARGAVNATSCLQADCRVFRLLRACLCRLCRSINFDGSEDRGIGRRDAPLLQMRGEGDRGLIGVHRGFGGFI